MILRNGKNISTLNNIQNDFVKTFYLIKSSYYKKINNNPSIDTKYTIANLYVAFKIFYNKEYLVEQYEFILYLSMNVLLSYKKMNNDDYCYICREHDTSVVLYCEKGHTIHLDCFYQIILSDISKDFIISTSPIRCDYCCSKLNTLIT